MQYLTCTSSPDRLSRRHMLIMCLTGTLAFSVTAFSGKDAAAVDPYQQEKTRYNLSGELGQRLDAVTRQTILPLPFANPAILEVFRDRNLKPRRQMVAFAGEFAGKYLTHAVQVYRLTGEERLREHIAWFVGELISLQEPNGYLGPWPDGYELAGHAPNSRFPAETWDTWGHYHIMIGLLLWHEESGDADALRCVQKIGDLLCETFLDTERTFIDKGRPYVNTAPMHSLALLHQRTGEARYLELALLIEKQLEDPRAGDFLRRALSGVPFHQALPRWESLHTIQAFAALYEITGEEKYRKALEHIWWSILETDRHNNGGFSSAERARGTPYHTGPIETCCTIAWMAMSADMLRLSGSSVVADELELSLLNSGLGMLHPSGRWTSYNTPMDGFKIASTNDLTLIHSRPGGAELNCCAVNAPRALGLTSEWAISRDEGKLVLNYYGPGEIETTVPGGGAIRLRQETEYPLENTVVITLEPQETESFDLDLRIPYWSERTRVSVNGESVSGVVPGSYLTLARSWSRGDRITIQFDFRFHFWIHEKATAPYAQQRFWKGRRLAEKDVFWFMMPDRDDPSAADESSAAKGRSPLASIYRGPLLLAYDPRFNRELEAVPTLDAANLGAQRVTSESWIKPWLLLQCATADGPPVRLCDFASAGGTGLPYRSWLPVNFPEVTAATFSRENPLRSVRCPSP